MEKIEKRIEKVVTRAGTLADAVFASASGGGGQSRGLSNFIAEIRNAKNKDEERARVDKELANIRAKFTSTANLTSYQKKKYVWKMCYISLLGYEVNFGHMECISLVSSSKFQEKSVGYMSVALLLRPGDELMMLAINSMRNDLTGHYDFGKCLALAAIANIGGMDFADTLCAEVQRAVVPFIADDPRRDAGVIHQNDAPQWQSAILTRGALCKKGFLCMLRLYRANRDSVDVDEWIARFITMLEDNHELGIVNAVMSVVLAFASADTTKIAQIIPTVSSLLHRLAVRRTCPSDYLYYAVPCPWIQVKCLRFLQYFRARDYFYETLEQLYETLRKILSRDKPSDIANKNNANHSILFEAINLVVSLGNDAPDDLYDKVMDHLGRFVGVKDANIRYLALDAMTRMTRSDPKGPLRAQPYQSVVLDSVRDGDTSVKKRALDLIFALVDERNAGEVVGELVRCLMSAQSAIKEEMVIKIAILAERFSSATSWYVDTLVKVILEAGDFVPEPVWHRVVMIVVNNDEVHKYAAERMLEAVQGKFCHETCVALGAYLLGEVGITICGEPGMSGYDQFAALHQHFIHVGVKTQAILLTAYAKLVNLYPDTQEYILEVFRKYSSSSQLELQQRACEYLSLPSVGQEIMENVLNSMPPFTDKTNTLLALNEAGTAADVETTDRSVWAKVRQKNTSKHRTQYPIVKAPWGGHMEALPRPLRRHPRDGQDQELQRVDPDFASLPAHKQSGTGAPLPRSPNVSGRGSLTEPVDLLALDDMSPPPAAAAAAASAGDSLSMLDGLGGYGAAGNGGGLGFDFDTMSLGGGGQPPGPVVGIPPSMAAAVARWHSAAVLVVGKPAAPGENVALRRALLFEDATVTIHYSAEYRLHQGRACLFVANKTTAPLTGLAVSVTQADYLTIKKQDPPASIAPGEEVRVPLMVECMKPFADSPQVEVAFATSSAFASSPSAHQYPLRLPITPASFFDPIATDKATYMARWKALEADNTEVQEIFTVPSPISLPDTMARVKATVIPALHIGVAAELDTDATCTGCCSFRTGTLNAEGTPIAVGAMMRLECDPGQQRYRVTVRAKHPTISLAIKNLLHTLLAHC